jgi:hypothetical protein
MDSEMKLGRISSGGVIYHVNFLAKVVEPAGGRIENESRRRPCGKVLDVPSVPFAVPLNAGVRPQAVQEVV